MDPFFHEEIMKEVSRTEKLAGIVPEPNIDVYMKVKGITGFCIHGIL